MVSCNYVNILEKLKYRELIKYIAQKLGEKREDGVEIVNCDGEGNDIRGKKGRGRE